jgi:uncharacterized protein (DUF2267 family)
MSGFDVFDRALNKANQWLDEVERRAGLEPSATTPTSRSAPVLQTLRDLLPLEEVVDFGAQLPMLLRGVYYEGWTGAPSPGCRAIPAGRLDRVSDHLAEAFLPPDAETVTRRC